MHRTSSIPGFTADRSCYRIDTNYRSGHVPGRGIGSGVTPQAPFWCKDSGDGGVCCLWGEYGEYGYCIRDHELTVIDDSGYLSRFADPRNRLRGTVAK
jgi:hypothetical protein